MKTILHGGKALRVLETIASTEIIAPCGPNWRLLLHLWRGMLHEMHAAKLIEPADTPCGYVVTERGRERMQEIAVRRALTKAAP